VQFVFRQVAIVEYIGLLLFSDKSQFLSLQSYRAYSFFSDKSHLLSSEFSTANNVVFRQVVILNFTMLPRGQYLLDDI
jgi:hypothetical protein